MRFLLQACLFLVAIAMTAGCGAPDPGSHTETPREQFLRLATTGKGLTFVDNQ